MATWRRLQRWIRFPHPGAMDLAFVLAYYGVDYQRNLQRLLLPDKLWRRRKAPMPENITTDLVILHRKHHDTASLGALLDLVLDGGPGEEQEFAIYQFWQRTPATLLRLATGSKTRQRNLEVMVLMEGGLEVDGNELITELRRFVHHPDVRIAQGSRSVLAMAKRDIAQARGRR